LCGCFLLPVDFVKQFWQDSEKGEWCYAPSGAVQVIIEVVLEAFEIMDSVWSYGELYMYVVSLRFCEQRLTYVGAGGVTRSIEEGVPKWCEVFPIVQATPAE